MAAAATPNWADVVSAVSAAVAAFGTMAAAGGVAFAIRQIGETKRDRHLQAIAEIGRRWDDERLLAARKLQLNYDDVALKDLICKWLAGDKANNQEVLTLLMVPNFFEDVAMMVEYGAIDARIVAREYAGLAADLWTYWTPAVSEYRKTKPDAYVEFENLATLLANARKRKPGWRDVTA